MRGQASLPALGIAFVLLTAVTVLGVAVAGEALRAADRPALERQAAVDLSDRLVAADAPITERANVLNRTALSRLNGTAIERRYGLSPAIDARIALDGTTVASTGPVAGGTTIERLVVVERRGTRTLTPSFTGSNTVTLPRRTARATVRIDPRPNTTVTTVRADDRVVLHNRSGLAGSHRLSLSVRRTVRLQFVATRRLAAGSVRISYHPVRTTNAGLEVTVDG